MKSRWTRNPRFFAGFALLALLIALSVYQMSAQPFASNASTRPAHERPPIPAPEELAKLPPDGGEKWNRLVFEQSPYLLQHAANPVNWFPWGEAAFEEARRRDVPIFLSIGYATCHWCHVMERESFEDPEVAAMMNAAFVCIKVDREERPDIDTDYMAVTQAMTGSGGWPMTVVMTPDKKPFFAGTYFPKNGNYGRPGMMDLIPAIEKAWKEQRQAVTDSADQIVATMRQRSTATDSTSATLNEKTLEAGYRQLTSRYDAELGGFGNAPKFPTPQNIRFLLRYYRRAQDEKALQMAEKNLSAMRAGGIYDHVGFGFHRYSTDRQWLVPHFEKMLYDQALLAIAYTEAYQATGKKEYRQTAEEILEYVRRDMTSPEGAFFSAEDADSEGEEGLFYLWTTSQIEEVLGNSDAKIWSNAYNVKPGGNFRDVVSDSSSPRNILYQKETSAPATSQPATPESKLSPQLDGLRQKLLDARSKRVRPLLDDKVLTDWNGLMISAYARAAQAFSKPEYAATARRAADFVLNDLRSDDGRLLKRWRKGQADHYATLEDYAFFTAGLLDLYEATFDPSLLQKAIELTRQMDEHFAAPQGGYFLSPDDGEELFQRPREIYDGAIPSGNSIAAMNLLRLGRMTGESAYEDKANALLNSFSGDIAGAPSAHAQALLALDFAIGPSLEIVLVGEKEAEDTQTMVDALHEQFIPNKVVLLRPPGDESEIIKLAPFTEAQVAIGGKPTAYVCRNFSCSLPTADAKKMVELMRK